MLIYHGRKRSNVVVVNYYIKKIRLDQYSRYKVKWRRAYIYQNYLSESFNKTRINVRPSKNIGIHFRNKLLLMITYHHLINRICLRIKSSNAK